MTKRRGIKIIVFLLLLNVSHLSAQQIKVDRGVRVNGLWCFPLISDSSSYLYLSANAKLSVNESSVAQFSFIRYVNSTQESKAK